MPTRIYLAEIIACVAKRYGMTVEELASRSRLREYVEPRQIAVYLCKQLTAASAASIGARVGGLEHSTILYSVRKVAIRRLEEPYFNAAIESLIAELAQLRAA
jgi:chromosomal replication initiator protein